MKRSIIIVVFLIIIVCRIMAAYVPGQLVFKVTNPISVLQETPSLITDSVWFNKLILEYNISELHQLGVDRIPQSLLSQHLHYYAVFDTTFSIEDIMNEMSCESDVVYAEPNIILEPLTGVSTNDTTASNMWGLDIIEMDRVWNETNVHGAPNVNLAIIDSGVDLGNSAYPCDSVFIHPDLQGNIWQAPGGNYGWNYYEVYPPTDVDPLELVNYPHDKYGHGTAVAGVVCAIGNNSHGTVGVAGGIAGVQAGVKVMPFRVLQRSASAVACYAAFLDAYYYGARIINFSIGVDEATLLEAGVNDMNLLHGLFIDMSNDEYNWGVKPLIIAAAGNNENEAIILPASYPEVLSVGATDIYDKRGLWSNGGTTLSSSMDIVAPGCRNRGTADADTIGIYTSFPMDSDFSLRSKYNSDYDHASGTSLAAPHVSAVAALVLQQFPSLTRDELRGRLLGTSDYIYDKNQQYLGLLGSGRLNAYRALTEVEQPNLVLHDIQVSSVSTDILHFGSVNRMTLQLKNWWKDATNVWGSLTTDDPNVVIDYWGQNNITWADIDTEETSLSSPFIITANGINRCITFTLTVYSDEGSPKEMDFTMRVQSDLSANLLCAIPQDTTGLNGSYLNNNFTVKDIDGDSFDELMITSHNGYLFIVQENGQFSRLSLGMTTTCTPAVADVNSDSEYEIIVGNNAGQVLVFSSIAPYALLQIKEIVASESKPLVTYISLEDMNMDGQLDIVAVYEKRSDGVGSNGFSIINMVDGLNYNCDTEYTIQHGVSIEDLNGNELKEVVFLQQNFNGLVHHTTNLYLETYEIGSDFRHSLISSSLVGDSYYDAGSSPMIGDLDYDGQYEILFRYEWYDQGIEAVRRKKAGLKAYHLINNASSIIWEYPSEYSDVNQIMQNDNVLIGDFFRNSDGGLTILYSNDKLNLLDSAGSLIDASKALTPMPNNYKEYILAFDQLSSQVYIYRLAVLAANIYELSAYDSSLEEDPSWRYMWSPEFGDGDYQDPIGLASIEYASGHSGIIIPCQSGEIILIPTDRDQSCIQDYSKYRYDSRHTGSYCQPIPREIENDTQLYHKAYIQSNTICDSKLDVNPGVGVLVDPNVTIRVYGELDLDGDVASPILISGTCLSEQAGYWNGIELKNQSESDIHHAKVTNASYGIRYEESGYHNLESSTFEFNDTSLEIYQAVPIIRDCQLIHSTYNGLSLDNGATAYLGVDSYVAGNNNISRNPVGIFTSQSYPLLKEGHNDIDNTDYNLYIASNNEYLTAQYNWWGIDDGNGIAAKINYPTNVDYLPWDTSENCYSRNHDQFSQATRYLKEGEYSMAIPLYHQVLADTSFDWRDHAAIKSLLTCYSEIDGLDTYRAFIESQLTSTNDNDRLALCYRDCLALVNRAQGFYSLALAYYEAKLDNCVSYADSAYALIDIGNTHLESNVRLSCRYDNLRPVSRDAHSKNTRALLRQVYRSAIFGNENPAPVLVELDQNFPNPFNPSTSISFVLPEDTMTTLKIYNIRGQEVKTLCSKIIGKGRHTVVWNGDDNAQRKVASGLYIYNLKTPNNNLVKKCILLK